MSNLKIAILGSNSHIAKGLINNFLHKSPNYLYLYTRSSDKVINFLSSIGKSPNKDCIVQGDYRNFMDYHYDIIINCVGVGSPKKMSNNYDWFVVTEEYDNLIIGYLLKNPDSLYINFSSGGVYGTDFKKPVNKKTKCKLDVNNILPTDYYAIAKINSEAKHRCIDKFNIVDIRIFSFFSRFININSNYFVCDLIRSIKNSIVFKTSPENIIRDYIHPNDLFSLVQKIIIKKKINDVFDTYSKMPISKFEIIEYFKNKYNLKYTVIKSFDNSTISGFKEIYYSKNTKASKIGYKPDFTSLECIVEEDDKISR